MPDSIIQQPLAIVSMACRLPEADSIEAYWKLLFEGRSAVGPLTNRVLDRELHFDSRKGIRGKTYTDVGGMVPERTLDRQLLGLSDEELAAWDECHLMFAEVAAQAWKRVQSSNARSTSSKVGVYIGHSGGSRTAGELIYSTLAEQTADLLRDSASFSKLSHSTQETIVDRLIRKMQDGKPTRGKNGKPYLEASAAARLVAEVLDLHGPRMVLDAACASSLVALGLASLDLQSGAVDAAIVGGASYNKVDSLILFSQAQSCSATASRPFDEAADGLISSEGFIALVVKKLDKALEDGDTIHAVLRGLGVATDGRGKSLWAPRREGQTMAMKRAYVTTEDAKRVQFVEAHATSTQVGDATETQALADFFGQFHKVGSLPVGSVKSNIGHTLETAGLAGLLKTILAMNHATIPPTIHLEQPSSSIDWNAGPFNVPTECIPWPLPADGKPRCGAVNAFGIGGLNVHVVVEQYQADYHASLVNYSPSRPANENKVTPKEPIAIVGFGVIIPGAQSAEQLSQLIATQQSKIVDPPSSRWRKQMGVAEASTSRSGSTDPSSIPTTARGGYLLDYAYDWKKHRVPPKQVDRANPLQFMLLDAAGQALDPFISNGRTMDQARTSVIVGTIFGGEFGHQLQLGLRLSELQADVSYALEASHSIHDKPGLIADFTDRVLQANPALLDETGSFTSSTLASRITKQFNLMGGAMAIDAGNCSGEAALATATEMLHSNVSDMVLCAAGQRAMDLPSYQTWASRGQLNDQPASLDLPGEGAVVLLLKRLSEAVQAGDKIHGIIHDVRQLDPRDNASPSETNNAPYFSSDKLIKQVGDLKSTQSILSIAALLASEQITEGQPLVIRSQASSETTYEIVVSRGASILNVDNSKAAIAPSAIPKSLERSPMQPRPSTTASLAKPTTGIFSVHEWADVAGHRPRITAVFPGQGSQSSTMLDNVLKHSNAAREALELADMTLSEIGSPRFRELCSLASTTKSSAQTVWPIQSSMLIADLVYAACMFEQGIRPDLVIGHSLGELAAMVVAGVWSLPESIRFVHARANAVAMNADLASGLLSINRSADEVQQVLASFAAPIYLTHDNSPNQCVVGGRLEYLNEFQKFVSPKRWSTLILNVPAAFHTCLMVNAQQALVDVAQKASLRPGVIPLLSTVTGRFVSDPAEIRRNLLTQLTSMVAYKSCVEQAYHNGSNVFVEVGPSAVLTKLNQAILKDEQATSIAMESNLDLANSIDSAASIRSNKSSSVSSASFKQKPPPRASAPSKLVTFDATAGRRQKRREQATNQNQNLPLNKIAPPAIPEAKVVQADTQASGPSELEAFVRDFIVEHTGYPAEMIEPDWDLEADLGIDSIKQAQLFGELRELFDIDVNRLASGQVRTMRQMVDVLKDSGGKREWIEDQATIPEVPSITKNEVIEQAPETDAVSNRSVIAEFMIDFVIEHTGYPREIVDMQADFEADLGLDSIKLAQLFGELRSNFDLSVASNDRSVLAKCRTLANILDLFPEDGLEAIDPYIDEPTTTNAITQETQDDCNDEVSSKIYAEGLAWGRLHAGSIHAKLVEQVDLLELQPVNLGQVGQITRSSRVDIPSVQIPQDRAWWQGASEGCGVDEECLSGDIDLIAALLESSNAIPSNRLNEDSPESSSNELLDLEDFTNELKESSSSITHRYQLKMVDSPLPVGSPSLPTWHGAAVVIGDNTVANALANSLASHGISCLRLNADMPREQMVAQLELAWKTKPVLHAFLAMPHDESAAIELSSQEWQRRRHAGMMTAFEFCQEWLKRIIESGRIQEASLIALTRLGGDFGFAGSIVAPESGTLTGLLKAMVIENWVNGHRGLAVKIIDSVPNDKPQHLIEAVYRELANTSYDMEISWANGKRRVVRADRHPIRKLKQPAITRGASWIFTGGGRGITAYVAEQLALRYDLTLHLVGTAPVPVVQNAWRDLEGEALRKLKLSIMAQARNDRSPNALNPIKAWENTEKALEIDATLRRFKQLGIRVHYYSCDCSNAVQLAKLVSQIRETSGPIRGCLHGAGVGQDARFDRKRPDKVEQCLSAKIDGSIALMEATQNEPLEFFIGFGSISGRFGANGHTDYSMANDGLAKCIGWYRERRPEVRAVSFHWHAWGDVGMATKPETKLALEMIDMQFMPAREGVDHLIREIEGGAPQREVLITDDRYYRLFYPSETLLSAEDAKDTKNAFGLFDDSAVSKIAPTSGVIRENFSDVDSDVTAISCKLDPVKDVFLSEHRLNDRPLLPMVIGLEAIVEAASQQQEWLPIQFGGPSIRVDYFESVRGLRFFQDLPQSVSMHTSVSQPGVSYVEIVADFHARNGLLVEANRKYMQGTVSTNDQKRLLNWKPVDVARLQWQDASYPPVGSAFFVGPAFRVLKQTCLRNGTIFGRIQAPSLIELAGTRRNVMGWRTPSAVLDACLFATGVLAWNHVQPGINLPVSIETLLLHKMPTPGETLLVESRFVRRDDRHAWFDFSVWGNDGSLRLEARSYRTAWLESQLPVEGP